MPNLRPLTLALGLSLVAVLAAADADAAKKKAPKKPAAPALTACTDFYTYANKPWLDANLVVADTGSVSALGSLRDRAQQQQRDLLDAAMRAPQGNVQRLLGDFWASGLDEAAVERDGANPIAPLLARINAIRKAKDIPASIAALHQVGIAVAFNFSPNLDLQDLNRHIGYFGQGGLGMPDPAYYTRGDADTLALMGRYRDYVQKILALTGTAPDQLATEAQQVIELETLIAASSSPLASLRDPRSSYAPVPTAGLAKQFKRLQLDDFLLAQGVNDDAVSLANPALFTQLDALVGSQKPAQWKAYLRFHVGAAMAPYLSRSFRDADFEFRGRVLRGEVAQAPRQQQVLDAINHAAGAMVGREYVGRYLPAANRSRAEAIATQVRDALSRGIDRNTWMDAATRQQAKAKLAALRIEIGAPARDLDYTVQPMGRGSFGSNMLIASTWQQREDMKRIGRGNADRRWEVLPQQPALAYDVAHNRLLITAAMLQPPVLDMAQDAASHYGTLGALVGHELTHAVDSKGRLVDATGTLKPWWTAADDAAWASRATRLSSQYGGYAYPNVAGRFVDGTLVREEAMADLAGLELAWDALLVAQPGAAKPAREAFYQGWARLWQQQAAPATGLLAAATSVHAPGQWRVNGSVANLPAFGETFACKAGTAMQRNVDDQVGIWR